MPPTRARWLTALAAVAATAVFFIEYLPPFERVHLFSDIEVYHYPIQRAAFDALKAGRLPLWDSSMYCGIPFAGNVQAGLFYPPAWLMYAVNWGRDMLPFQALQCFVFAHVALAFLLCYWWLRRRGIEALACAFGASVFAFGGYMMWQLVHVGVATAIPWMPLAFAGIDDAAARRDWRPLWKTALASALWFLAGYPPSWAAFAITVVVYALASDGRWRVAIGAVGAIATSMLLAAVQVLPALEASSMLFHQTRYTSETKPILLPLFVANWRDFGRASPLHYLDCMYVYWGVAAGVGLVCLMLGRPVAKAVRQPLVVIGVCLFLLFDPGHVVYYTIVRAPGLDRTLQSYNFLEGATAMAALITALGIGRFLKHGLPSAPRWLMPACVLAMAGWSAREIVVWSRGGAFASGTAAIAESAAALVIFAFTVATLAGETGARRKALAAMALLFVFVDYKAFGTNRHFNTRDGRFEDAAAPRGISAQVYRTLRDNRHFRVTSDGSPSSMEFRMWGLASPQGLDPLLPEQYRSLIEGWKAKFQTTRVFRIDYTNDEMLQRLGVRYAITYRGAEDEAVLSTSPRFRPVGPDDSFYRVYEYTLARAPFGFDGAAGEAAPADWTPERRVFRAASATGGRFGLVEQFYPGWQATVDGRPVTIERWRGAFQSISVPPGEHTVAFEYRSRWMGLGAAISLVSLVLLAALVSANSVSRLRHSQR